jgi:ABC-type lipoprotein export system ATPase subunit
MVFQTFNLIKSLNVWENVALPQTALGIPYSLRKKRALHILKLLQIEKFAERHANELSGGQQQRVAIARALINNPAILLVDEPTGNLDSKMADEVMRLLHDLNFRVKQTVILVTHNPDHLKFGSRIIYFKDGQIEHEERPSEEIFAAIPSLLPEQYYDQLVRLKGR